MECNYISCVSYYLIGIERMSGHQNVKCRVLEGFSEKMYGFMKSHVLKQVIKSTQNMFDSYTLSVVVHRK